MKKTLLIILFFSYSYLHAQYITTYFFNADFVLTSARNYQYKATIESAKKHPEGAVKIRVELKNGKLIQKYQYSDLEKGLKKDTTFIFNEDGTIYSLTPYNNKGEIISELVFHKNGKLFLETYYKKNVKSGITKNYYESGKLHILDHYENGVLTDTSYTYRDNGIIKEKKMYANGNLNKSFSYNTAGTLTFEYTFEEDGDTISAINHDTEVSISSIPEKSQLIEELPVYTGGVSALYTFLSTNIKYPRDARDNSIQGKVMVKFVVDDSGEIRNIQTTNPIYPLLDFEAMRVINTMPAWVPGKQNGDNVDVLFSLPVLFRLE